MFDKTTLLQHIENRQRTAAEQSQIATNLDELKMPEINKYGRYVHRAIRKASDRGAERAEEIGKERQRGIPLFQRSTENRYRNDDLETADRGSLYDRNPAYKEMNARADSSFNRADRRKYRGSDGGIQSKDTRPWIGSGYANERRVREAENEKSKKTGIGRAMEKLGIGTVHDLGREIKRGISLAVGIDR